MKKLDAMSIGLKYLIKKKPSHFQKKKKKIGNPPTEIHDLMCPHYDIDDMTMSLKYFMFI